MTWLADFHEKTDLNRYPTVAFRGGVGYRKPTGETVSNFVGHPVHYFHNGLWKPITLQRHANGDFEGSDFSWRGKQVFYKGKTLFEPRAVIFNGVEHKLFLRQDGNRIVADLTIGGSAAQYEIQFRESGVRELLTIFEPVEGLLEFDVPHANKPEGLQKTNRHIVQGSTFGESFQLTKEMSYPLDIDPNYSTNTDYDIRGAVSSTYSTARDTGALLLNNTTFEVSHTLSAGDYFIRRVLLQIDASGIPDGDFISLVNLSMYCTSKNVTGSDYDIQVVNADWSSLIPVSSNVDAAYDLVLSASLDDNIWQNSASISGGNRYDSGDLSTSWVSKTGYTYYGLISSRDRAGTSAPTGVEEVVIASQDNATSGNRPYLTVTHAAAAVATQVIWFS